MHCKVFKELERLRRIAEKEEKERQEAEKQARIEAARRVCIFPTFWNRVIL